MFDPKSLLITPADLPGNRRAASEPTIPPGDPAQQAAGGRQGERGRPANHQRTWHEVPWRTIVASAAVVLGTYVAVAVVLASIRIISWVVISGFFALVLAPAVRRVQARMGGRRGVATGLVVMVTVVAVVGMLVLFIMPIRSQAVSIATDLPGAVQDAADGRGAVGDLVDRLGLVDYVQAHERELQDTADRLTGSQVDMAQRALGWVITVVTILLITILMLSQSMAIGRTALELVPHRRRDPVRRAANHAARAVSGYMIGNLLISAIAGVSALVFMLSIGVPNALVLALLVAVTDLIPLVGATIGAAICTLAAFLDEPRAGIIAIVFFVVFQQVENYLIYPAVMSRTVNVNPLVVLLSVLAGVELFGILGAVLAVPISGALQVAVREARRELSRQHLVLPPNLDLEGPLGDDA